MQVVCHLFGLLPTCDPVAIVYSYTWKSLAYMHEHGLHETHMLDANMVCLCGYGKNEGGKGARFDVDFFDIDFLSVFVGTRRCRMT